VARVESRNAHTIESIYQAAKIFNRGVTGLDWRGAKGRKPNNQKEVTELYSKLWDEYVTENPHLLEVLKAQSGLSDIFGREGSCCQATELWRIRNANSI
jgi:sulfatase maturation enzyme AslB (radical SAM superfamily)